MLVFGATDHAAAVAAMGTFLGYRVTVCDARPVFATASRFPSADEVVVDWPHRYLRAQAEQGLLDERTVVCVLSHDPKFDVPVLEVALRLPRLGYVGAMGSRRTADRVVAALRVLGLTDAELARLSSPIGLDLGRPDARGDRRLGRGRDHRRPPGPRRAAAPVVDGPIHGSSGRVRPRDRRLTVTPQVRRDRAAG